MVQIMEEIMSQMIEKMGDDKKTEGMYAKYDASHDGVCFSGRDMERRKFMLVTISRSYWVAWKLSTGSGVHVAPAPASSPRSP